MDRGDPIRAGSARADGGHPDPAAPREPSALAPIRPRRRSGDVAVWPRGGASPVDAESKNDFFDSMYHAAGAVGINTSAQIECGIVGRPVFSIRTPAYQRTQEGTLHFRHLTSEGGGLLRLADDFDTHVRQIAAALDDPEEHQETGRGVRPGVHPSARTRCRGDAAASSTPSRSSPRAPRPAPKGPPLYVYPLRAVLYPTGRAA